MAWRRIGDKSLCEPMLTRFTEAYMRHKGKMSEANLCYCQMWTWTKWLKFRKRHWVFSLSLSHFDWISLISVLKDKIDNISSSFKMMACHCTSITWTNEDIFQWCICRSSGHDEFFHSLKGAAEWPTILAPQRNWRTLDTHEDDFPLDS